MHTDETLQMLDDTTTKLGNEFRYFAYEVCRKIPTKELAAEQLARIRRELKKAETEAKKAEVAAKKAGVAAKKAEAKAAKEAEAVAKAEAKAAKDGEAAAKKVEAASKKAEAKAAKEAEAAMKRAETAAKKAAKGKNKVGPKRAVGRAQAPKTRSSSSTSKQPAAMGIGSGGGGGNPTREGKGKEKADDAPNLEEFNGSPVSIISLFRDRHQVNSVNLLAGSFVSDNRACVRPHGDASSKCYRLFDYNVS